MQSSANDHVQELRSKVLAERALVSALDGKTKDHNLKQQLQQASYWLDDVENVFLGNALQERRTPDALSRWLTYAETPIQLAVQRRKQVQEIIDKYGSNAQSI